jgi:hypothetical protein
MIVNIESDQIRPFNKSWSICIDITYLNVVSLFVVFEITL